MSGKADAPRLVVTFYMAGVRQHLPLIEALEVPDRLVRFRLLVVDDESWMELVRRDAAARGCF
jgi:hypothetical protein